MVYFSKPGSLEELYIAPAKGLTNGTSDKTVEFLAGSFSNATARWMLVIRFLNLSIFLSE